MNNIENLGNVPILQFCSIPAVFQNHLRQLGGVFGLSRAVLEASWAVSEVSWRRLGGVKEVSWGGLGASWTRLGASWTCLGENIEKMLSAIHFWEGFCKPKWRQKSLKFALKMQLAFRIWRGTSHKDSPVPKFDVFRGPFWLKSLFS